LFLVVLDVSGDVASLLLVLLDLFQSLAVDVDVEVDAVGVLVDLDEFVSAGRVVNNEVFTSFFTLEIDSSDVGFVVGDWEDVDLNDFFVYLFAGLQKEVFKLLVTLFSVLLLKS